MRIDPDPDIKMLQSLLNSNLRGTYLTTGIGTRTWGTRSGTCAHPDPDPDLIQLLKLHFDFNERQ
jgi:hypothetical protein